MKKNTLNRLLISLITLFTLLICFLIVQIIQRPRYINLTGNDGNTALESSDNITDNLITSQINTSDIDSVQQTNSNDSKQQRGKTSTKVNIRELPSEDARVLTTVEGGYEFDILEILDNGWTKISYEDSTAYISSLYVILIQ